MMTLSQMQRQPWRMILITLLVCLCVYTIAIPIFASAQGLSSATGASAAVDTGTSCSGWSLNPVCIMRGFFAGLGTLFMSLGIKLLTWVGMLFEFALHATVVNFRDQIFSSIEQGVNTAWSAFRDIANIIIIGIFTFIAISIILGLQQFGQKKMIARVLIIAVLINFSLLFTKMIIDASNFTALQLYNGALKQADEKSTQQALVIPSAGDQNAAVGSITGNGISGSFMKFLGVGGIADSYDKLRGIQENNDNALLGLLYGLVSFVFLVATALVFLYGTFLLVSRALLFIFLMVTASLAFASYLVPSWETSSYGWKAWWQSLIGSAVLAPALMLFLWITLNVSSSMSKALCGGGQHCGTLGALMTTQTPGANMGALFNFVMILGMLFISFKLSSWIAGKTSGFSIASAFAAAPITLGSRFGVGNLGRLAVGLPAYFAGKRFISDGKKARDAAGRAGELAGGFKDEAARATSRAEAARAKSKVKWAAGDFKGAAGDRLLAMQQMQVVKQKTAAEEEQKKEKARQEAIVASKGKWLAGADYLAKSRYNVADTKPVQKALKEVGVTGFAAGGSSKAFLETSAADQIKTRTEAAEKIAAKFAPSADDNEKAKQKMWEDRTRHREELRAIRESAITTANELKGPLEAPLQVAKAALAAKDKEERAKDKDLTRERGALRQTDQNYDRAHRIIEDDEGEKGRINAKYTRAALDKQIETLTEGITDAGQRAAIKADIDRKSEGQRASELAHQTERIRQARLEVESFESTSPAAAEIQRIKDEKASLGAEVDTAKAEVTRIETRMKAADADVNQFTREINALGDRDTLDTKEISRLERGAVDALADSMTNIAEKIGRQQGDPLTRLYGKVTFQNKAVGDATKDLYKKKVKTARFRDAIKMTEEEEAGGPTSTPPATPPTT